MLSQIGGKGGASSALEGNRQSSQPLYYEPKLPCPQGGREVVLDMKKGAQNCFYICFRGGKCPKLVVFERKSGKCGVEGAKWLNYAFISISMLKVTFYAYLYESLEFFSNSFLFLRCTDILVFQRVT